MSLKRTYPLTGVPVAHFSKLLQSEIVMQITYWLLLDVGVVEFRAKGREWTDIPVAKTRKLTLSRKRTAMLIAHSKRGEPAPFRGDQLIYKNRVLMAADGTSTVQGAHPGGSSRDIREVSALDGAGQVSFFAPAVDAALAQSTCVVLGRINFIEENTFRYIAVIVFAVAPAADVAVFMKAATEICPQSYLGEIRVGGRHGLA